MKLGKHGKKVLLAASAVALVLSLAGMLLLKPQGIPYHPQIGDEASAQNAGAVVDLGAMLPIKEILWKNNDGFVAVCSKDDGYIWIFYGSVKQLSGEQRSVLTLKENESYCSSDLLDDGAMAVVTTKRLIYLDEGLSEKRSVMLRGMDRFSEAALSPDGSQLAYITTDGLRLRNLGTGTDLLAVPVHLQGDGTVPLLPRWIDSTTIGYRYIQENGRMNCGLVQADGSGQQLFQDSGLFASFGGGYISMEAPEGPDTVNLLELSSGRSTSYELEDNMLCALAQSDSLLCAVTLSQPDGVTYFNRMDFSSGAFSTVYAIPTGQGSINGKTAVLSPEGKLAVELYPPQESNAKVLVVDLLRSGMASSP